MAMSTRNRWVALFATAAMFGLIQVGIAEKPGAGPARTANDSPVYRQAVDRIRFDHSKHATTSCTTCHGAANTSQRASDSLMPAMEVCATCHASGEQAPSPKLEQCGACHVGHDVESKKPVKTAEDWRSFRPAPMPAPKGSAQIRFDHARHVALAAEVGDTEGCGSCHAMGPTGPSMPSMASCETCHDGSAAGPSAACATCHPTDGKVLQTTLSGGSLKPTNHDANFAKRHGTVAAAAPDECASCHLVEEDCASCHVAAVAKPFAVHPPNYMAIHAVDARSDTGDCTDCHKPETFCTSCHTEAKAVTRDIGRPPDRLQYHPQGWLDGSLPNNHGVMARRNLSECASCHVEDDCVTCHAGVNPHPPNFALECRQMANANSSMCRKCHDVLPPCL